MLKIVACDDEYIYQEQVKKLVSDVLTKVPVLFSYKCFSSGEGLFHDLQDGSSYDIALLDIQMKKLSGIDIADNLRKYFQNDKTILIYISAYDNMAKNVFQFNPHRFLSKPIEYHLFEEALLSAHQLWKEQQTFIFSFKDIKQGNVKLPLNKIFYLESVRNRVNVITADYVYTIYDVKLSDINKNLEKADFILIHHSTLVNFEHIRALGYEQVQMCDGKMLGISGPKRKHVRLLFHEILKKQDNKI